MDVYTNPYTPPSLLPRFPRWISRFLGYREVQKPDVGNVLGAIWSCVGAFVGLAVVAAVFNNTESIQRRHPPALIASFGASAILEYNAIRSPLSQPRNTLLGHTISATVGVSITKLFLLSPLDFEAHRWIAGAISCGLSSALMLLTGTVHPPGGASAVLAATSPDITDMGWYFVGLVVWGSTLMFVVGLVVNNVQRQFPVYWWTPVDLRELQRRRKEGDVETPEEKNGEAEKGTKESQGERICIDAIDVRVPEDLVLSEEEERLLDGLKEKLRKRGVEGYKCELDRVPSSRPSSGGTCMPVQSGSSERVRCLAFDNVLRTSGTVRESSNQPRGSYY